MADYLVMPIDVFILAAGEQQRWGKYPIKQLLPINGEPLILRTIRLLGKNKPIVVTHRPEIIAQVPYWLIPKRRYWTTETLLSTSDKWYSEQIVILLGDVLYSPRSLDLILSKRGRFTVFGSSHEIFALSFYDKPRVIQAAKETIEQAARGEHFGKLRNLYHTYYDIKDKNEYDTNHPHFEKIHSSITDYVTDFDTPEQYEAFVRDRIGEVE